MTSLLAALINLENYGENDLDKIAFPVDPIQPRVNIVGGPLDHFVRDAFCDTFAITDPLKKGKLYKAVFSYFGDQNHPPDMMLLGSDAIEVKKVASLTAGSIQLNSSFPKSELTADSSFLTNKCKNSEKGWKKKDLIYAVGHVQGSKIRLLTFVYGDCYASDSRLYESLRDRIIEGIKKIPASFSETVELGRINGVDPLKITNLRIRGMWLIKTPLKLFSSFIQPDYKRKLSVFAVMRAQKFDSFDPKLKAEVSKKFSIASVQINDPDKPSRMIDAVVISFFI